MSIGAAVNAEATLVTWTPARGDAVDWIDGDPVRADAADASEILVAVQPCTGRALLDLPEGKRSEDMILGYTEAAVGIDDQIEYEGENYRVNNVERWSEFRKLTATLVLP